MLVHIYLLQLGICRPCALVNNCKKQKNPKQLFQKTSLLVEMRKKKKKEYYVIFKTDVG